MTRRHRAITKCGPDSEQRRGHPFCASPVTPGPPGPKPPTPAPSLGCRGGEIVNSCRRIVNPLHNILGTSLPADVSQFGVIRHHKACAFLVPLFPYHWPHFIQGISSFYSRETGHVMVEVGDHVQVLQRSQYGESMVAHRCAVTMVSKTFVKRTRRSEVSDTLLLQRRANLRTLPGCPSRTPLSTTTVDPNK